jgi:UDP-N-acetylmuramoyl-L-alanyl-D-glutamate--2,6-diaminopimelate ligase
MNAPAQRRTNAMTLEELFVGIASAPSLPLSDITTDSRRVREGSLFLACRGLRSHGLDYLDDVVSRGACAVAYDSTTGVLAARDVDVPLLPVPYLCGRLGALANRFFDAPSDRIAVIGVTGTNGKSTVAWLLARCLTFLGQACAYNGTLGYGFESLASDDEMTSPDVIELHRRLAAFRDEGAACAAIEVSSHALDQDRVAGVRFEAVIFTNLSRDHLDYHGNMDAYGAAKARLFEDFGARYRIVNVDTGFGTELAMRCGPDVVAVSAEPGRERPGGRYVFLEALAKTSRGSRVAVRSTWGECRFDLPLIGRFNVANAACVLGLLLVRGVPMHAACEALGRVTPPPGRMQNVAPGSGLGVYVDYAHTPDALRAVLGEARSHTEGALWCVFGCGGARDTGKRPEMGRIAALLADRVIVTSDNPRTESPAGIIDDILAGITDKTNVETIEDRAGAIATAIARAGRGDTVLIAGKGHETCQVIGDRRIPFSDADVAAAALAAREGGAC